MAEKKDRSKKIKKQKTIFYVKIGVIAVVILAIVGGGIYTVRNKSYDSLVTSVALHGDIIKAVTTQAFIVRDEDYVTASDTQNIVAAVDDGTRVGKNTTVAYSFADASSAVNINQINEIQNQLDYYNRLASSGNNSSVTEIDVLDEKIQEALYDFISGVSDGDLTDYEAYGTELRERFAEKQISMGQEIDVSSNIASLETKLNTLKSSVGNYSVINAEHPGYYISSVDGYENTLDYSKMEEWSFADIQNAVNSKAAVCPSNAIGKLVNQYYWYIACIVESDSIPGLSVGNKRTISFPYSTAGNVKATVCRLKNNTDGKTLVVFKCNKMDGYVCELRNETIQIYISEYSGCKVDNKAIREITDENDEICKGVYIVRANTAVFKKIYIYYSTEDYSIVDYPPDEYDEEGNKIDIDLDDYLSLYDEYIIGGTDLYDGKYLK